MKVPQIRTWVNVLGLCWFQLLAKKISSIQTNKPHLNVAFVCSWMHFWSRLYALKCWDEVEWKEGYDGSFLNRERERKKRGIQRCNWALLFIGPPHVVLDWFQFGIQSMKRSAWASGCIQREDRNFLATKSVQFMTIFRLNDCKVVCVR